MIFTELRASLAVRMCCVLFGLMLIGCGGGKKQLRPNDAGVESQLVEVVIDDSLVKEFGGGQKLVEEIQEKLARSFKKVSVRTGYASGKAKAGEIVVLPKQLICSVTYPLGEMAARADAASTVDVVMDRSLVSYETSGYGSRFDLTSIVTGPFKNAVPGLNTLNAAIYKSLACKTAIEYAAIDFNNQFLSSAEVKDYTKSIKQSQSEPAALVLEVSFSDKKSLVPNNVIDAFEESVLTARVTNKGRGMAFDVALNVEGDSKDIEFDKFIRIGDIPQGETREVNIALNGGPGIKNGKSSFTMFCTEKRGYDSRRVALSAPTAKLLEPKLEIVSTEVNDAETGFAKGNGNGIPENGETVELIVFVKNQGDGMAIGVDLNGATTGTTIQWVRDSAHIGTILSGETSKAKLAFAIPRNFDAKGIAANLRTSDVRGIDRAEKKVPLTYVKRSSDIKYAWRMLFRGSGTNILTNGEDYEMDLTLSNNGEIAAKDVFSSVSSVSGLGFSENNLNFSEIKAGESVSRRIGISVPRNFGERQALLNIKVTQADFSTVSDSVRYEVAVRKPKLTYLASLQSRNGGNALEQGESSILELQALNEGGLSASGVRVSVKSKDENLRIVGATDFLIGIIPANSRSETIKVPVSALRRIKTGDVFLDVNITQEEFSLVSFQYAINIIGEGAIVVDVDSEKREHDRPAAKAQSGPEINLKGAKNVMTTSEESYRLFFDVKDPRNIELITVAVNGVVTLRENSGLKRTDILRDIQLVEGSNKVVITAYNADNISSTEVLVITRLAEEDVDTPRITGNRKPDAVAVVIGVSRYENKDVPRADYARRDAATVKEYLVRTLGFDEKRVIELYDDGATLSKLNSFFRTKLKNLVVPGKSDVFVFYSGHGVPDVNKKEPYLATYGLDPTDVENTGYVLKDLYEQLARIDAKSVTVAIDSCFSGSSEGGAIIKDISPLFLDVSNPMFKVKNGVIFTASSSTQVSSWYHKKQHGLFTYFFLLGMRGKADYDNDGQVTVKELEDYVTLNVAKQARLLNRVQTPEATGAKDQVLVRYR